LNPVRPLKSGFELLVRLLRRRGGNTVSHRELMRAAKTSSLASLRRGRPPSRPSPSGLARKAIAPTEKTESDLVGFANRNLDLITDTNTIVEDAISGNMKSLFRQDPRMLRAALEEAKKVKRPLDNADARKNIIAVLNRLGNQ
jgi:hypothetical protein